MNIRFKSQRLSIYKFYNKIIIHCPKCQKKAFIEKIDKNKNDIFSKEILYCNYCGYNKKGTLIFNSKLFDLWLKTDCNGKELWALNEEHLKYLKEFVQAKIRERKKDDELGWSNQSLESRIPNWIKSAKNRDKILKCIQKLEKTL
jgi:hypothetical protein